MPEPKNQTARTRSLAVGLALLAALLAGTPATAQAVKVRLQLPIPAGIDLEGRDSLAAAPFIVVRQEGQSRMLRNRDIDVQGEFERYLLKVLRRDTDLQITEMGPLDYPTFDLTVLERDRDFWRAVGERARADLILAGSLDFDIQDKSGYRLEEYVSPYDGRTYYRQVLVEQTGFEYDILMQVYDADSGELLYSDNFKDFKSFEGEGGDPLTGMFANLASLEDRIAGVFTQKKVEATRTLYTN